MALRIGELTWDSLEELKELEAIVHQAIIDKERENRYYDHLKATCEITTSLLQKAKDLGTDIMLYNPKTGEHMTISPQNEVLLIQTPFMKDFERNWM